MATSNQTKANTVAAGYNYFTSACQLISRVEKETASTVSGSVTSKVWVDNAQPGYVARRFEINPTANAAAATGKVTLYFKQSDFDDYNLASSIKLPSSPSDIAAKANLVIEKYEGTSNTGTVASFGTPATVITPDINDVVWNDTYKYWEVSFQTSGFGGYFVKTSSTLGTADIKLNSEVNITPNPAKDFVNVTLGKHTKASVTIYDASGKLVKTVNVNTNSGRIDVSELVKGTYMFTITLNDNQKITKKIIKQ
ncbi:T9SS type A sorting domain-containing protein [Chryseobacterium arthrosphaerae]|uniref:T9SS type A sorting domain-containing protein n=1 Tax=Chryseobacterium arthrosphaerae TaxID=651561 RepID=A0A3S0N8R9_9FLAO|nr:T9SS type A sorting domain-containing protein [Chryseobacterium arthrosphaerae]